MANPTDNLYDAGSPAKRESIREMFAEISPTYDLMNSAMSMRLHHRWRRHAAAKLGLKPGDRALDICCGTGDFAWPLRRAATERGKVVGFDYCLPMLGVAVKKRAPMQVGVADACRLPVRDKSFDGVSVGWGLRNVASIEAVVREVHRVLREGGRFVSIDMAVPKSQVIRFVSRILFHRGVPALGALFGAKKAYAYLPKSTDSFESREIQSQLLREAGFKNVGHEDLFFGNICVHWGQK